MKTKLLALVLLLSTAAFAQEEEEKELNALERDMPTEISFATAQSINGHAMQTIRVKNYWGTFAEVSLLSYGNRVPGLLADEQFAAFVGISSYYTGSNPFYAKFSGDIGIGGVIDSYGKVFFPSWKEPHFAIRGTGRYDLLNTDAYRLQLEGTLLTCEPGRSDIFVGLNFNLSL